MQLVRPSVKVFSVRVVSQRSLAPTRYKRLCLLRRRHLNLKTSKKFSEQRTRSIVGDFTADPSLDVCEP